ncbi:unnamed protein product [Cuscuta campestris]|uniref:Uncharacterized protein n=1 Tax=Cuscuta campestris TaxID=132261 RepID=A0A484K4P1_9ASTE|nr:unnamed protein product [Cuscuta campestris]
MPTFTTIALENLLEPRVRDSCKSPLDFEKSAARHLKVSRSSDGSRIDCNGGVRDGARREGVDDLNPPSANHIYISPALYITPEPAPIPEVSAGTLSPSPYVVNHKRRGREHVANRKIDGFSVPEGKECGETENDAAGLNSRGRYDPQEEVLVRDKIEGDTEVTGDGIKGLEGGGEEFLDPACDVSSVGSASEFRGLDCHSMLSAQGDFFDANEEFSSEGSASNASLYGATILSELHTLRLKLIEEAEKRKAAEDALALMQNHWLRIRNTLYQEGLTLPSPSDVIFGLEFGNFSINQAVQELAVARYVAEAIGKGEARAESEDALAAMLETKNQEISRLRDRLQYYKAVNHEMSQRNQEIVDAGRKRRQRKRTQQKWVWSGIGFSAIIAASVAAYMYLPQASIDQSTSSCVTDSSPPPTCSSSS